MGPGDSGSIDNFNSAPISTGIVSADHKFYSNEYGESKTIDKGGTSQDRYAPVKYAPVLNKKKKEGLASILSTPPLNKPGHRRGSRSVIGPVT